MPLGDRRTHHPARQGQRQQQAIEPHLRGTGQQAQQARHANMQRGRTMRQPPQDAQQQQRQYRHASVMIGGRGGVGKKVGPSHHSVMNGP